MNRVCQELLRSRRLGNALFAIPRPTAGRVGLAAIGMGVISVIAVQAISALRDGKVSSRNSSPVPVSGAALWLYAVAAILVSFLCVLLVWFTMQKAIVHEFGLRIDRNEILWSDPFTWRWSDRTRDILMIQLPRGLVLLRVPDRHREALVRLLEAKHHPGRGELDLE